MDVMNKKKIPRKIKKRYEYSWFKKINNLITDLHWKSIKYLTNNYNTIFIGDWSTIRETSFSNPGIKRKN